MKHLSILFLIIVSVACTKKQSEIHKSNSKNNKVKLLLDSLNASNLSKSKKDIIVDKAFNLIVNLDNDSINRNNLLKLMIFNIENQNWEKFNKNYYLLFNNSIQKKDSINIANCYRYRAGYYRLNGVNDSAYYYYIKAENSYEKLKDDLNTANILLNKSIIQFNINDLLGAELSISKSFNIYKNYDDKQKLFQVYTIIGNVSNELKDYEKAIDYHNRALRLTQENNLNDDYPQIGLCLNNIGNIYKSKKDFKKSIEYFNKGLLDLNLEKDPELKLLLLDNLGYSKLKVKDYSQLPDLFFESLKICDSLKNNSNTVFLKIHISEYYSSKKDTINAKNYALQALKLSKKAKIASGILFSLQQISSIDSKNSIKYSKEYIRLNDSLQLIERKNIDRFARIELETDELRQANTQLSEQNRDILNYFAIAIVFGGFLFFARFQRLKARELALKQTQQQANEEIYRLIISHQNQLEEGRDLEKKRISKELHDGVLGRLFGLRLNLDGLNNFDDEETKQQRLDYLNELKVIEQDLREISHELSRENLVLINNFVAIINNLLEQQSKINKAKINTLISDKIDWEKVSNTIKINLYRILQESLQNINKHAEANKINVIFNKDPKGNLIFSIEDDGKGYNTNGKKTKGIGMNNIVDRVHQCQGKIDIKSQIGKGTKIIITFPLENETINM